MEQSWSIVKEAIRQYPLTCKSIQFIGQSANTVFQIRDQEDRRYSFRIHRSKSETFESIWSEPDAIRSEMDWLDALTLDTDLTLPSPVRNVHGNFITGVNDAFCTLTKWVEGEQRPAVMTGEEASSVGAIIGKLHRQSSNWNMPSSFNRPVYDGTRILQSLDKLAELAEAGMLHASHVERLQIAGRRVIDMMNAMERSPANWGIIHADLIPSNMVFRGNEAIPIDFGACGFGFYLFDLGWTFSYIHPALRETLLHAYSTHHLLPDHYVERLEGFFIAGQLETMHFWLGLPDWQEWLPDHIAKLTNREVKAYVHQESFLFGGMPYWE